MWGSAAWLRDRGIECTSCKVEKDLSNATAPRSCFLLEIDVAPFHLVLKQLASDENNVPLKTRVSLSKDLGLAREGLFYETFRNENYDFLPKVFFASGSTKMAYEVAC